MKLIAMLRLVLCTLLLAPAPGSLAAAEEAPWTWAGLEILGNHSVPRSAIEPLIPIPLGSPYRVGDAPFWSDGCEQVKRRFDFADVICGDRPLRVFDGRKAYLIVDVVEKGQEDRLRFREAPSGSVPFGSDEIVSIAGELGSRTMSAAMAGHPYDESGDKGYLSYVDPNGTNEDLGPVVDKLARLVPEHRGNLLDILKQDKDPQKRQKAANLLCWAGGDLQKLIRTTLPLLDDPDPGVRNNLSRFMLHFVGQLPSKRLHRRMIDSFVDQIERPSHGDRNKGLYNLLTLASAFPADRDHLRGSGLASIRYLAENSIVFNVQGPARELLALIEGTGDEATRLP
ncbi:MAG: HEAT repeat domain-containing protein [Candidatus Polarisedimenticolia bacterium]